MKRGGWSGMVLAAGLGTRLRPLTNELPKPLCPLGDEPILDGILGRLADAGADHLAVNAHHHPEAYASWLDARTERRWSEQLGLSLHVERELRGTAGGLCGARDALGAGDVVVWNGDILAELDVAAVVAAHRAQGATATLVVRARGDESLGPVAWDKHGVRRLRGSWDARGAGHGAVGGDYLGIAVLSATAMQALPERGCLVGDVWIPMLLRGERLAVFETDVPFSDLGTPAEYWRANMDWLAATGRSVFAGTDARVDASATLDKVIVGRAASVAAGVTLREVVVWPGANADRSLTRAVVTPRAIVELPSLDEE